MLGERYLWVDSLFIVQGDFDVKQEQIDAMAEVYGSAAFTIIIATGSSMHDSVPGISVDRPGRLHTNMLGMSFLEIETWNSSVKSSPEKLIENSTWYKRGWTYQERVLSTKKLYFSDNDVFFQCSSSVKYDHLREAIYDQKGTTHEDLEEYADTPSASSNRFLDFRIHLSAYTKLSLTNESVILNVFAGTLHALVRGVKRSAFGLPLPVLDHGLLWVTHNGIVCEKLDVRRIPGVSSPSWSWASTRGCQDKLFMWTVTGTLVTWF